MSDDFTVADFLAESSKRPADLPVVHRRSARPHCDHHRVAFDPHKRHAWCRDCEADLDPFDVIALLARTWDGVASAREERARLLRECERLEAEEKRIKARIRNARRTAPPADGEISALRDLDAACRRASVSTTVFKALSKVDAARKAATGETGA